VLIDFINEVNTSITWAKDYHRFLGGSPTNVAVNARLGFEIGIGSYMVRTVWEITLSEVEC
jgi:fructokinase